MFALLVRHFSSRDREGGWVHMAIKQYHDQHMVIIPQKDILELYFGIYIHSRRYCYKNSSLEALHSFYIPVL